MTKILCIESSTNVCSIAIHEGESLISTQVYHLENSHSSLLPEIIKQLFDNSKIKVSEIDAIAVSVGPGSYTGLRIGVSTAKGLAFANNIPIIRLDTLELMCQGIEKDLLPHESLLCPMIDARRMEVYCLLSNLEGDLIWDSRPLIVEENSFKEFDKHSIYFFGNGSGKCNEVLNASNHHYLEKQYPQAQHMGEMAYKRYIEGHFEDLAYLEPNYLKEFRTNKPAAKFKL